MNNKKANAGLYVGIVAVLVVIASLVLYFGIDKILSIGNLQYTENAVWKGNNLTFSADQPFGRTLLFTDGGSRGYWSEVMHDTTTNLEMHALVQDISSNVVQSFSVKQCVEFKNLKISDYDSIRLRSSVKLQTQGRIARGVPATIEVYDGNDLIATQSAAVLPKDGQTFQFNTIQISDLVIKNTAGYVGVFDAYDKQLGSELKKTGGSLSICVIGGNYLMASSRADLSISDIVLTKSSSVIPPSSPATGSQGDSTTNPPVDGGSSTTTTTTIVHWWTTFFDWLKTIFKY